MNKLIRALTTAATGLALFVVLAAVIVITSPLLLTAYAIGAVLYRRERRRWYRRLVDDRPPLPDAELIGELGLSPIEADCWIAARAAVAEECGLPPEAIRPDDLMPDLRSMNRHRMTQMIALPRLGRHLGAEIPPRMQLKIIARRRRLIRAREPRTSPLELSERFADLAQALAREAFGIPPRGLPDPTANPSRARS